MPQTLRCSSQTYWYENGVQRARYCDRPATMTTEALDGSRNHSCAECGASAIEAGARLVPQTQPCRSGHTDCTVDCGWCKGTGRQRVPQTLPTTPTTTQEVSMTTFAYAGTVSHGTLREEDLVPAFLSTLRAIDAERAERIEQEYAEAIASLQHGMEHPYIEHLVPDLIDALNDVAPEGWSFGAHEGDGSDFGFWWGWDETDNDDEGSL